MNAARHGVVMRTGRNTRNPPNKQGRRRLGRGSAQRAGLPAAELVEELVLLLRRHGLAAGEPAALAEELGKDLVHLLVVDRRCGGDDIALEPGIGGRGARPARPPPPRIYLPPLLRAPPFPHTPRTRPEPPPPILPPA